MTETTTIEGMHHVVQPVAVQHDFYLDFVIESPEQFYDFFTTVNTASSEDVIYLHINSPGGSADAMVQIIGAIRAARCPIIAIAEGQVASAAAMIFFACHGFSVNDFATFLIHNGMGGQVGKPNDNLAAAGNHHGRVKKIFKDILGPFFTKKEIKQILNGREYYLDSEEVVERLEKAQEEMEDSVEEE